MGLLSWCNGSHWLGFSQDNDDGTHEESNHRSMVGDDVGKDEFQQPVLGSCQTKFVIIIFLWLKIKENDLRTTSLLSIVRSSDLIVEDDLEEFDDES